MVRRPAVPAVNQNVVLVDFNRRQHVKVFSVPLHGGRV